MQDPTWRDRVRLSLYKKRESRLYFTCCYTASCRRSRYNENMPILTKRGAHITPLVRANSSRSEMLREMSLCVSLLCAAIILNGKCTLYYFTFVLKDSPKHRSLIFNDIGLSLPRSVSDEALFQEPHYECKNKDRRRLKIDYNLSTKNE